MKGRRSGLWLVALAAVGILFVVALVQVLASYRTVVRVTVQSVPGGATIFDGRSALGFAPLSLQLVRGESRTLRVVRRDYQDAQVELQADSFIPSGPFGDLRAALRGREEEVTVRLQPIVEENTATSPDATPPVSPTAPDQVAAYYRELIRKEPRVLVNYAELAHHYVVNAQFNAAAAVLREGFDVVPNGIPGPKDRYFAVMVEIYTRYFVYPPETPDDQVRSTCRELMRKAQEKGLRSDAVLQRYLARMDAYDAAHPPDIEPRTKPLKRVR